ncbi:unnamed protein product, partial [Mesorhabditis spiculigera]
MASKKIIKTQTNLGGSSRTIEHQDPKKSIEDLFTNRFVKKPNKPQLPAAFYQQPTNRGRGSAGHSPVGSSDDGFKSNSQLTLSPQSSTSPGVGQPQYMHQRMGSAPELVNSLYSAPSSSSHIPQPGIPRPMHKPSFSMSEVSHEIPSYHSRSLSTDATHHQMEPRLGAACSPFGGPPQAPATSWRSDPQISEPEPPPRRTTSTWPQGRHGIQADASASSSMRGRGYVQLFCAIYYVKLTLAMRKCITSDADCTHVRCCTVTAPASCVIGMIGTVAVLEGENEQCIYYAKQSGICASASAAAIQLPASAAATTSTVDSEKPTTYPSTILKTTTISETTTSVAPPALKRIPRFLRGSNINVWRAGLADTVPTPMYCNGNTWWYGANDPGCDGSLELYVNPNGAQLVGANRNITLWTRLGWVANLTNSCGANQTIFQYQGNPGFQYLREDVRPDDGYDSRTAIFATWSSSSTCVDQTVKNQCLKSNVESTAPRCG